MLLITFYFLSVISFSTTIHIYGRRLVMGCCRVNAWYRRKISHFSITAFLFKNFNFKYLKNIVVLSQFCALFAVLCIIYVNKKNSSLKWGVHEILKLKKYKYIYICIYIYINELSQNSRRTPVLESPSPYFNWHETQAASLWKFSELFFKKFWAEINDCFGQFVLIQKHNLSGQYHTQSIHRLLTLHYFQGSLPYS